MNISFLACVVLFLTSALGENPGLRTAITTKGLNYVCHSATILLERALPSLSIPDIHGRVKVKAAFIKTHIDYSVSNIKLQNLDIPGCSFTPGSNGITLQSSGISVEIKAHIRAKHKHFPHVSASTDIKVDLKDVSFSATIKISRDVSNGHASLTATGCSANVGRVHVSFHGHSAWLYKLFDHKFESALKKGFHSSFCSGVTRELNQKGSKVLESLPLTTKFDDAVIINYTLTQDPVYTSEYMAIFFKGEFQPIKHPESQPPFVPAPLPPIHVDSQMVLMWLTDYLLNTASYSFQQAGRLTYTVTPKLIPKNVPFHLNTSSFKPLVPSLYKNFPDKDMQIVLRATKPPNVKITPKGGELVAFGSAAVEVILPNEKIVTAFTLAFTIDMDVFPQIHPDGHAVITANVSLVKASFTLSSSNIGEFDATPLQDALNFFIKFFVVPAINRYGTKGLKIPTIDGLSFINPHLSFGEGYAVLSTDIKYKAAV